MSPKKIIYLQGLSLAAIGIPFGLVLGGIFGKAISYKFTAIIQDHVIDGKISPIALAISVLFSLLVVIISARKPGNIAGKVSPVEAVKFSGLDISGKKKKVSNENFSIFNFALENLKRNIKKTIMVGLSISMAAILRRVYFWMASMDIGTALPIRAIHQEVHRCCGSKSSRAIIPLQKAAGRFPMRS